MEFIFFIVLMCVLVAWATNRSKRKATAQVTVQPTAMRKCPYCAEEIRAEAIKCRFCSSEVEAEPAPLRNEPDTDTLVREPWWRLPIIITASIILVIYAIGVLTPSAPPSSEAEAPAPQSAAEALAPSTTLPPAAPSTRWSYNSARDELTGREYHLACTDSVNRIRLDFPYSTQPLELCLRQHPRFGQDVIIRLPAGGQFVCPIRNCLVRVRFGSAEPSAFTVLESADHSSDTLFVSNDTRFIAALRNADEIAISANYYQAGDQTGVFQTTGLRWPPETVPAE